MHSRRLRRLWSVYGGYALGFVSLFLIWQLASLYVVSSVLFPPPSVVLRKGLLLLRNGVLLEHLWASVQRILAGFIAGSLLGIPIGLAMGSFRPVRKLLEPYTEFLRFIPSVAMITVAVIWFGIGEASKVFLIIYTTIVAAELIAANDGLGKMLWDGRLFMLVDEIFVSLVTLGFLGFATDRLFRWSIYTFAGKYSPAT